MERPRLMRERETKLLVARDFRLPRFDDLGHGLRVGTDETIEQTATYFDTPDLRLTRSGASLRYRSDDGWTVKLPQPREGSNLVRIECSFPGDPNRPPPAALDLVRAWTRTAPIEEVAKVRTSRHRVVLNDAGGSKVAEVDDDRVTTEAGTAPKRKFREVEVELSEDAPDRLDRRLAKHVKQAGRAKKSSLSKVAIGLGVREVKSSEPAPSDLGGKLERDATTLELVRAAIGNSVRLLLANDPVIRIGEDPEGVHQARVATRRLRSDLRTLGAVLDENWSAALRADLQWLGTALGKARDVDVLTTLLQTKLTAVPDDRHAHTQPLFNRLAEQREHEREALLTVMRSDRYAALLDDLVDAARDPFVLPGRGSRRARKVAPDLARKPWKRLCRAIRSLGDAPSDADLHRVRRKAKQARYALEAINAVGKPGAAKLAERAAAIQGTLGDHQDRTVARAWLADATAEIDQSDVAFAAGEVAGLLAGEQSSLRRTAQRECRIVCKRRFSA
jgi:CHAD domain-containing protein